jgi:ABC-type phosphate/phosphonate transport system substrate-binding protein
MDWILGKEANMQVTRRLSLPALFAILVTALPQATGAAETKAAFAPPASTTRSGPIAPNERYYLEGGSESSPLVFSAPPRGSYAEEVAAYQPIAELLSEVIGKKIVYQYSDNWLSYSKDMTMGRYDIVFDGPAFNGWRAERLSHVPLVKLPEDFVFVVVTRADDKSLNDVKDLAGRMVCAHAPPNLGTLTMLSRFDNPSRQPRIVETKGWDNSYKAMLEGKCVATVVPIKNLQKLDKGPQRASKTLYTHRAMPNQALSVGPRVSPELRARIAQALLSEKGKLATAKLRAAYAGKDFVPATREEYAGLGDLLKDSLYYY